MRRLLPIAVVLSTAVLWLNMLGLSARAQAPPQLPALLPGSTGISADPIDLFKEIYPVFAHPRCVNCHGVVQTVPGSIRELTGQGHLGGPVRRPPNVQTPD